MRSVFHHTSFNCCTIKSLTFLLFVTLSSNPLTTCVVASTLLLTLSHLNFPCNLTPSIPREVKCRCWCKYLCTLQLDRHLLSLSFSLFHFLYSRVAPIWSSYKFIEIIFTPMIDSHLDDRLLNDCEQLLVGGQDHGLSAEWNVGNKICAASISAVD